MALALCPSCTRHVRVSEDACPFCGAQLALVAEPPLPAGVIRSRAALFSALALSLSAAGCTKDGIPNDTTTIVNPYGAPQPTPQPTLKGPDAQGPTTAIAAPYGAPPDPRPVDAGASRAVVQPYGAPRRPDGPDAAARPAPKEIAK